VSPGYGYDSADDSADAVVPGRTQGRSSNIVPYCDASTDDQHTGNDTVPYCDASADNQHTGNDTVPYYDASPDNQHTGNDTVPYCDAFSYCSSYYYTGNRSSKYDTWDSASQRDART
jgi:hypothetical protein